MKSIINRLTNPFSSAQVFNIGMLFFRITISLELIIVHGFKKTGIGVAEAEKVPDPFHMPEVLNNDLAILANIFFPFLVLIGLFTRLATIPTLILTMTGYFIMHWNDTPLVKDTPYVYSVMFLLILILGPGKYSIDNYINKSTN